MNSEVKAKWLQALKSGEYRQTRDTLRSPNNGYCCLGVLCDVYNKEVGGYWQWEHGSSETYSFAIEVDDDNGGITFDSAETELPLCVMEWAGLDDVNPQAETINEEGEIAYDTLAGLNDSGHDFKFIADVIDNQF
jgi:hypothetical protein